MDEGLIYLPVLLLFTGLVTFTGWRCWTGRWRFFTRQRTFLNNAWPLSLFVGGALLLVALAGTLGYLGEEVLDGGVARVLTSIASVLLLVGGLALIPSFLAVVVTIAPDVTYRAKPDGNVVTRRLLPRWYQDHLRAKYHGPGPSGGTPAPSGSTGGSPPPPPPGPIPHPDGRSGPPLPSSPTPGSPAPTPPPPGSPAPSSAPDLGRRRG